MADAVNEADTGFNAGERPAGTPHRAELDARKARILCAIVAEYVSSAEPVGSKRVVDIAHLDVSPATVRNEMSALEELGYISQPHTSAGRVPTDRGYRYFVDQLAEQRLDQPGDAPTVELPQDALDVDEVLRRTTRVLSEITHLVSLVVAPRFDLTKLKLLELVSLSPQAVLVLLVTDTGRVDKRLVELRTPLTDDDVQRARTVLNDAVREQEVRHLERIVDGLADEAPPELEELIGGVARVVGHLEEPAIGEMYVGGAASLAGQKGMERADLSRVLEVLEERVTLARLLAEANDDDTLVRIGEEHEVEELYGTSLIAKRYQIVSSGSVGVLGPTRMDYASVLSTVKAVADRLQETLRHLSEG